MTLSGRTFETSRKIPETVFATGQQTIVEDLLDGDLAQLHTGTVALGIRHVLCTPLRLVRYVERAEQKGADEIIGVLYLDSRERGALRSASRAVGARHAVGRSGARDRERAALPRGARQGEVRAGAEGRGGDSAVAAAGRRTARARSSRRRRRRSPAARSAATSTTTSICRPAQFGFIVGDVAGKGSPAALLAAAVLGMFSAEATYQTGAAPLMTRLNHGLFRRAIEARFLTTFYGMLGAGRLADLLQRRPQRAAARVGVRHPPARDRRRRARPLRARDVRGGDA